MRNTIILSMAILMLSAWSVEAQKDQPIELGKVDWLRDYDTALKQSKEEGKPVLILFQEVPGCSTSQGYGTRLLSNGMIVDAIENEFIPLAIYNNVGGKDSDILKKYKEPTWNNPVVRVVDEKGKNIVARLSGDYSENGLITTMANALRKHEGEVPAYVDLLQQEYARQNPDLWAGMKSSKSITTLRCFLKRNWTNLLKRVTTRPSKNLISDWIETSNIISKNRPIASCPCRIFNEQKSITP